MASLWLVSTPPDHTPLDALLALLPADECARATQFRRGDDRVRYLTGRAALRLHLARSLGMTAATVPIITSNRGKPQLAADIAGPCFNLSHSGDWVLLGLADRPIGVDIEQFRSLDHLALAEQVFGPSECQRIREAVDPRAAFFDHWVVKEAYLKAAGLGLADLSGLSDMAGMLSTSPKLAGWATVQCGVDSARQYVSWVEAPPGYHAAASLAGTLKPSELKRVVWSFADLCHAIQHGIDNE